MVRSSFRSFENQPLGIIRSWRFVHNEFVHKPIPKAIAIARPMANAKGIPNPNMQTCTCAASGALRCASCAPLLCRVVPGPVRGCRWGGPPRRGFFAVSPLVAARWGVLRRTSYFDQLLPIGASYVQHQHAYQENRDILCPAITSSTHHLCV
jgi:hypothetical protein